MKIILLALIFIFLVLSTSSEHLTLIPKSDAAETKNITELEKFCHDLKIKYENNSPLSEISSLVKNILWNESVEKHKYFLNVLNQDDLETIDEVKWIEIFKITSSFSMNDQSIQNFILNMISTRFCCCNEIIRTEKQRHELLDNNIKSTPKNFFIVELKNVLDLKKIAYHYEAKEVLKLFIECSLDTYDTVYESR